MRNFRLDLFYSDATMGPVGHSLTGLAIGCAVLPEKLSSRSKVWLLAVFVVLANAPDLPCPAWGHERYEISHSLLVTTIGVACLEIFLLWKSQAWPAVTLPVAVGMAITWYSHLLLDTFYNHGKGLAIYWPWSNARLALPILWFDNLEPVPVISWHNASVCAVEATVYGSLLVLVLGVRGIASRRGG